MKSTRPICITDHAKLRLAQRMQTRPDKMLKVAKKAWGSKTRRRHESGMVLVDFLGYIFVFDDSGHWLKLVTVKNPREEF